MQRSLFLRRRDQRLILHFLVCFINGNIVVDSSSKTRHLIRNVVLPDQVRPGMTKQVEQALEDSPKEGSEERGQNNVVQGHGVPGIVGADVRHVGQSQHETRLQEEDGVIAKLPVPGALVEITS